MGAGLGMLPVQAQQTPPAGGVERAGVAVQHPWNSLSPEQRNMLAPLQSTWDQMPQRRQARMLDRAKHWETLDPDQRAAIRRHIEHWQQMTPEERKNARANMRKFHQLSPAQRKQLHATFERFQQLPPAQRDKLLREWRALPPEQRLHWTMPASAGSAPKVPPRRPAGNLPPTPPAP